MPQHIIYIAEVVHVNGMSAYVSIDRHVERPEKRLCEMYSNNIPHFDVSRHVIQYM